MPLHSCPPMHPWPFTQVIAALKHYVPVSIPLLLGLNCAGKLQSLWRDLARQVTDEGGTRLNSCMLHSAHTLVCLRRWGFKP